MLKDLPPVLKPFVPLVAAMGVIMFIDFGLLLVGEWQDQNHWSFGIRLAGLSITIAMGFWFRYAFKKFKAGIEEERKKYELPLDDPSSYAPAPEDIRTGEMGVGQEWPPFPACVAASGYSRKAPVPRCAATRDGQPCGCLAEIKVDDLHGYCVACYIDLVEARFKSAPAAERL